MALYLYRTKGKTLKVMRKCRVAARAIKQGFAERYAKFDIHNVDGTVSCITRKFSFVLPEGAGGSERNLMCGICKCPERDHVVRSNFKCNCWRPSAPTKRCVKAMFGKVP